VPNCAAAYGCCTLALTCSRLIVTCSGKLMTLASNLVFWYFFVRWSAVSLVCLWRDAQHLPQGRSQAGDRHSSSTKPERTSRGSGLLASLWK